MFTQELNGFTIEVKSADTLGGFPLTGKNDAAIIEVYKGDDLIDMAWVVISKNGIARLERV